MARALWSSPVRRVLVHGPSMAPALRHGDQLLVWTLSHPRPRAGSVVVVDLPGARGLGVKRVVRVEPDGALWLQGDNASGSTDSRDFGGVTASALRGRVLLRLWPRPGRVSNSRPEGPDPA